MDISERSFEDAIEEGLLEHGPDAAAAAGMARETLSPYGDAPGGYHKRRPEDYDRALCLLPRDVVDFVLATQPREWQKLAQHHGAAVKEQFLARLAAEIGRRGALDVLRTGVKDSGCAFRLAYFRPASGLNEETRRLHAANLFAAVRQLDNPMASSDSGDRTAGLCPRFRHRPRSQRIRSRTSGSGTRRRGSASMRGRRARAGWGSPGSGLGNRCPASPGLTRDVGSSRRE